MKLLYIDCCITVHGSASRTAALAETFLSAWRAAHPEADIETLDLKTLTLNPLLGNALRLRETLQGEGRTEGASFALARQFAAADRIVIAAPYWELSFPAQLRLYIEHIAAQGITFDYTSQGQVGLCGRKNCCSSPLPAVRWKPTAAVSTGAPCALSSASENTTLSARPCRR